MNDSVNGRLAEIAGTLRGIRTRLTVVCVILVGTVAVLAAIWLYGLAEEAERAKDREVPVPTTIVGGEVREIRPGSGRVIEIKPWEN